MNDIGRAIRTLARQPAFSGSVVLVLALGIASVTVVFSFLDAVLLRDPPFRDVETLVRVVGTRPDAARPLPVSYPEFARWREHAETLSQAAASGSIRVVFRSRDGGADSLVGEYVSPGFFQTFAVRPLLGRFFTDEEAAPEGGVQRLIVLSEGTWRARFGGDPRVVGSIATTGDGPFTVIGVAPAWFGGLTDLTCRRCSPVAFWWPASAATLQYPGWLTDPLRRWHTIVARLAPNATPRRAEAELGALSRDWRQLSGERDTDVGVSPLSESWRREARPALFLLLTAAGLVMAIAWGNTVHLFRVRQHARRVDVAVARALGAGTWDTLRPAAGETVVLAVASVAAGAGLAYGVAGLFATLSGLAVPGFVTFGVDARALAIAAASASAAVLGLLAATAWRGRQLDDPVTLLRGGSRATTLGSATRIGIAGQVALATALAMTGSLLVRSAIHLATEAPGFEAADLAVFELNPTGARYAEADAPLRFVGALRDQLARRTGSRPFTIAAPHVPPRTFGSIEVAAADAVDQTALAVDLHRVLPGFFATLGVRTLAGRVFDERDDRSAPSVAIVSRSLANRLWPGTSPLGRVLIEPSRRVTDAPLTIVGVADDVRYRGVEAGGDHDVYVPFYQVPLRYLTVAVRTGGDLAGTVAGVRSAVAAIDPELPILAVSTVEGRYAEQAQPTRFHASVVASFASIALVLATVGIYGTTSFALAVRRREWSVRMAVGATPGTVLRSLLAETGTSVAVGIVLGLLAAAAATRGLGSLLYGVGANDPVHFVGAVALLSAAGLAATLVAGRRAYRIDVASDLRGN